MSSTDRSQPEHIRLAPGLVRWLLLASGFLFVGLAALGAVLPILPTTPFVIVAAACFARSSPRFYRWLHRNRVFGPLLRNWESDHSVSARAKATSVLMIALVGGASIVFFVDPIWAKILLSLTLTGVIAWLLSRPTATVEP